MLPPAAETKPKTPIALARSSCAWNSVTMSESATAETTAPPQPWIARAATSAPCVGASPQASEASVNSATPTRNMRRGP
jgi:hypothetical protein